MALGVKFSDIVPYTSVFIDCSFSDILFGVNKCTDLFKHQDDGREDVIQEIQRYFVTEESPSPALPVLAARTALDLYLRVCAFPPGSEIIFSAINIPDMAFIARQHGLRVIPCDIDLDTLAPQLDLLESLITPRTVAFLVAHLFGRWLDISPIISIAQKHGLKVIEDCAEAFCGFDSLGSPRSDLVLWSFGPIKFFTAFGGGIAKVKDGAVFEAMQELHDGYDIQTTDIYLRKLIKCTGVFCLLDLPTIIKPTMFLTDKLNIDHKRGVVQMLRGFPTDLMIRLRHRPPTALLEMLLRRFRSFDPESFWTYAVNGQYVWDRLPRNTLKFGESSIRNNFWLFPVLVENPAIIAKELNRQGIDAYIGASQLSLVEPEPSTATFADTRPESKGFLGGSSNASAAAASPLDPASPYPSTAKFFVSHVIYLPVNWTVTEAYREKILAGLHAVIGSFCTAPPCPPQPPPVPAVRSNFLRAKL